LGTVNAAKNVDVAVAASKMTIGQILGKQPPVDHCAELHRAQSYVDPQRML
jgi:hypothetical protein